LRHPRYFHLTHDSVRGRRHIGITGPEARALFPDSVRVVPKKSFPNPDKNIKEPIVVENYHIVDWNHIFMHNLAATQDLIGTHERLKEQLVDGMSIDANHSATLKSLQRILEMESAVQLIQKTRAAEARAAEASLKLDFVTVSNDERRKTHAFQSDQDQLLAEIKQNISIEAFRFEDALQRDRNSELVSQKEASAARLEQQRRATEELLKEQQLAAEAAQAELDRVSKLEEITAEAAGRMKQERENEDVNLRKLEAQGEQDRKKLVGAIETALKGLGEGFVALLTDRRQVRGCEAARPRAARSLAGSSSHSLTIPSLLDSQLQSLTPSTH
jgi:hypothetical protein